LYCTSHESKDASVVRKLFSDDEGEKGTEKHCFCHSCCSPGYKSELPSQAAAPAVLSDEGQYPAEDDSALSADFKNGIPIRSPPAAVI
ncbi:MAG TPA: hypothetical protein VHC46_00480, partial [Thermodesulfobacteriota bacterium]|nr:hypothetical protein [Thermodesulfobacteriota bacterium]